MSRYIDLTGQRFGRLKVISKDDAKATNSTMWKCLCDCGNEAIVSSNSLRSGHTKSCGCLNFRNLTGKTFGQLTVIERVYPDNLSKKHTYWKCKCRCGNETTVTSNHLMTGHTRSCGCSHNKLKGENSVLYRHGKRNTRLYRIWSGMKSRCLNKNNVKYKNYGARGIKVCDEWKNDFMAFYNWAISNGYRNNLSIDRINNDDNYEPDNCRWITLQAQNWNTTRTKNHPPKTILKELKNT